MLKLLRPALYWDGRYGRRSVSLLRHTARKRNTANATTMIPRAMR
jgi:hypothetical protein